MLYDFYTDDQRVNLFYFSIFNYIMEEKKKEIKKNVSDEEVEKIFESTWNNLASRRRCEQEHIPEYIKRQKRKDND